MTSTQKNIIGIFSDQSLSLILVIFDRHPLQIDDNSLQNLFQNDGDNTIGDVSDMFYSNFGWLSNPLVRIAFDFYDVTENYSITKEEKAKWLVLCRDFNYFLEELKKIDLRMVINYNFSFQFHLKLK